MSLLLLRSWENGLRRWRSTKDGGEGTNCLEIEVRSISLENKRATEKGRRRKGTEQGGGRWEISTSSITNSCPSIGCRYIQTLLRKGQSLCRPLCRPRAFLLLSLSTTAVAAPPSLIILSRALSPPSFTPPFLLSLVSLPWKGEDRIPVPMEDAAQTRWWKEKSAESG